jgi:predicted Na+-dependent transporter
MLFHQMQLMVCAMLATRYARRIGAQAVQVRDAAPGTTPG